MITFHMSVVVTSNVAKTCAVWMVLLILLWGWTLCSVFNRLKSLLARLRPRFPPFSKTTYLDRRGEVWVGKRKGRKGMDQKGATFVLLALRVDIPFWGSPPLKPRLCVYKGAFCHLQIKRILDWNIGLARWSERGMASLPCAGPAGNIISNKKYVLSISESVQCNFFSFDHVTFIQFKICYCVQNFIKIGWFSAEIWRYNDFQNSGCDVLRLDVEYC